MSDKRKRTILSVVGMVALLIVLSLIHISEPGASSAPEDAGSAQPAPSFCPFCGEGLPSSFQWGQYCPYCGEQVEA